MLALAAKYCRARPCEKGAGIMRSAPNRHAPIALQHPSQSAYFHSLVRRFVGRVIFGLSDGADTTQPPL
jgi:hypothetical protein